MATRLGGKLAAFYIPFHTVMSSSSFCNTSNTEEGNGRCCATQFSVHVLLSSLLSAQPPPLLLAPMSLPSSFSCEHEK
jgi:hypothetical protein